MSEQRRQQILAVFEADLPEGIRILNAEGRLGPHKAAAAANNPIKAA